MKSVYLALSLCTACLAGAVEAAGTVERPPISIVVRPLDEIVMKEGSRILKGRIIDSDTPGQFNFRDAKTGVTQVIYERDIKTINRRSTPETELDRIFKDYSDNPVILVDYIKELISDKYNLGEKVLPRLEKAMRDKSNPELLEMLGNLYIKQGLTKESVQTGGKLISVTPNKPRGYLLRGRAHLAAGNLTDAKEDLAKAFKIAPTDEEVIVANADLLLSMGKPDDAKKMFNDALRANDRNYVARIGLGNVQLRLGEVADAEATFNEAQATLRRIGQDMKVIEGRVGLGAVALMQKNFDEVEVQAKAILQIDTRSADAYALRAYAKLLGSTDLPALAKFDEYLEDSLKLRESQPRLRMAAAAAMERKALLEEKAGKPEASDTRAKARAMFDEILTWKTRDDVIQYFIGQRKFENGDYTGAKTAFQAVIEMSPAFAPAHGAMGATLLRLKEWDGAKAAFVKAIEIDKNQANKVGSRRGDYHAGIGLALLGFKESELAFKEFEEALRHDPTNAAALNGKGYIANYQRPIRRADSIDYFQQALAADGNSAFAADALKKIYEQDNMTLEYARFDAEGLPPGWGVKGSGGVKPIVKDGKVLIEGQHGSSQGKILLQKALNPDAFVRFEADLKLSPGTLNNCVFGIRLSASGGPASNWELEFGKDENNQIKVRSKDANRPISDWTYFRKEDWPADNRIRLGIDTLDVRGGKFRLWINGKKEEQVVNLTIAKSRVVVSVFAEVKQKERIEAEIDNIVIVAKNVGGPTQLNPDDVNVFTPEAKVVPAPATEKKTVAELNEENRKRIYAEVQKEQNAAKAEGNYTIAKEGEARHRVSTRNKVEMKDLLSIIEEGEEKKW